MSRAFRIDMNGAQEASPNASTATGLGVAIYDDSGGNPTLEYTIVVQGLDWGPFTGQPIQTPGTTADNVTDAHFHQQVPGVSGPVRFGWKTADADDFTVTSQHLSSGVPFGTVHGIWETTDPINLNTFAASFTDPTLDPGEPTDFYANIHTVTVPGGEIRGQLVLLSTDGDDVIHGVAGARDDILPGLGGNDTIFGGAGADALHGGTGTDTAAYGTATVGVTARLDNTALNSGDAAGDSYVSIENLSGSNFRDTLVGDGASNQINGLDGNDSLYGEGANDTISGGLGNDYLYGGPASDMLDGGGGFDFARYDGAPAGPGGIMLIDMVTPVENTGDAAGDTYLDIEGIVGSSFADSVFGNNSNNELQGRDGNDVLDGRGGNDTLTGGLGEDDLNGGAGNDTFIFRRGDAAAGDNMVDFDGMGAAAGDRMIFSGYGTVAMGAHFTQVGTTGTIHASDGGTETLNFLNLATVHSTDFTFI